MPIHLSCAPPFSSSMLVRKHVSAGGPNSFESARVKSVDNTGSTLPDPGAADRQIKKVVKNKHHGPKRKRLCRTLSRTKQLFVSGFALVGNEKLPFINTEVFSDDQLQHIPIASCREYLLHLR